MHLSAQKPLEQKNPYWHSESALQFPLGSMGRHSPFLQVVPGEQRITAQASMQKSTLQNCPMGHGFESLQDGRAMHYPLRHSFPTRHVVAIHLSTHWFDEQK
jgi:hypothetical protein